MLIEAEHVSGGVAESCGDLGCVSADRLRDLAAVCDDEVQSGRGAVDHNVNHKTGRGGGRTSEDPGTADFADSVIERDAAVAAFPDIPAKDFSVELSRGCSVNSGNLDVADLAIRKCGRLRRSSGFKILTRHQISSGLQRCGRNSHRLTGLSADDVAGPAADDGVRGPFSAAGFYTEVNGEEKIKSHNTEGNDP